MCREKFAMITMIWFASFVMTDAQVEAAGEDDAYIAADAKTIYNYSQQIGLTAVLFAAPMYGWLTDKLSTEYELVVAYGVRSIAGFAYFSITDPSHNIVIWTIVAYMLSSNFEEVCIDALFSKRLPGDIRGAMLGLLTFFGKLGHFTFALIAIFTVEKHGITAGIITVAICDAFMVMLSVIISLTRGFDEDQAAGIEAREKGKALDVAQTKAAIETELKLTEEIARLRLEN